MLIVTIEDIKTFLTKLPKANQITKNTVKWGQQDGDY